MLSAGEGVTALWTIYYLLRRGRLSMVFSIFDWW